MSQIWRVYLDEALVEAAFHGDTNVARALLALGADPHAEYEKALREAASSGHDETARVLVAEGGASVGVALRFTAFGLEHTTASLLRIFPDHTAVSRLRNAIGAVDRKPTGLTP